MPRADRLSANGVKLLQETHVAIVSTIMPDGSPQSTPTWVDVEPDGSHVLINTVRSHLKARNVARDPRIAVTVIDSQNPYRTVTVRGRVVEQRGGDHGATEHIHALAQKYMGRPYPLKEGEQRVILRIKPTHVIETGVDDQRRWRSRGS